jgi:hypothetical protein
VVLGDDLLVEFPQLVQHSVEVALQLLALDQLVLSYHSLELLTVDLVVLHSDVQDQGVENDHTLVFLSQVLEDVSILEFVNGLQGYVPEHLLGLLEANRFLYLERALHGDEQLIKKAVLI